MILSRADERVAHNADMEAADVEIATLYRMIEQKRQRFGFCVGNCSLYNWC